jgi:hypothetical protein
MYQDRPSCALGIRTLAAPLGGEAKTHVAIGPRSLIECNRKKSGRVGILSSRRTSDATLADCERLGDRHSCCGHSSALPSASGEPIMNLPAGTTIIVGQPFAHLEVRSRFRRLLRYEAALTVISRETEPQVWAVTQYNLGNAGP